MLPERSRSWYMGTAPPSACLLTAADSLLSACPMSQDFATSLIFSQISKDLDTYINIFIAKLIRLNMI